MPPPSCYLSFVVMDNHNLMLSNQGHPAMMRGKCKQDVWCAGRIRIFPVYGQVMGVSGWLPNVKGKDREYIESLLYQALEERGFFINLVWM